MLAGTLALVFSSFMLIYGSQLFSKEAVTLRRSQRSDLPDLCSDLVFDAIFECPSGGTYVLKGKYYWKLTREGISSGSPRLISHIWPELPSDIDAATAFSWGRIYFFKGNKFWTCYYSHCTCAYISVGWPGIPDHVNGVTWAGGYIFYFFKGDLYWRFDASRCPQVPASYPKPLSDWGSIKGRVDDVLYVDRRDIYFFTNGYYYRYDCVPARCDSGKPSQPRYPCRTSLFFQCDEKVSERSVSSEPSTTSTTLTIIDTTTASSATSVVTIMNTTTASSATAVISTVETATFNVTATEGDQSTPAIEPDYGGGNLRDQEYETGHAVKRTDSICLVVSLALIVSAQPCHCFSALPHGPGLGCF